MTTEVETARQTVAELEAKLAAAEARFIELETERRRIALDALTGDGAAEKRLKALNTEAAHVHLDVENIRSAIEEAKRRLGEAERAEERRRLAENAEKANTIAARLGEHARKLDEAFAVIAEESNAWLADITEVNRLGISNPRAEQFAVLGALAANAALMFTPLKIQHIAPKDRRSFSDLASGWSVSVSRWAASFLGDKAEAA